MIECLPAEEEDVEDIEMPSDERRDESEGEEQAPMEDEEQRDGSVAEHEGQSKQDLERVKKALMKLHTNLGHPGVKEMVRVLKHGRASELAIQEARRMRRGNKNDKKSQKRDYVEGLESRRSQRRLP